MPAGLLSPSRRVSNAGGQAGSEAPTVRRQRKTNAGQCSLARKIPPTLGSLPRQGGASALRHREAKAVLIADNVLSPCTPPKVHPSCRLGRHIIVVRARVRTQDNVCGRVGLRPCPPATPLLYFERLRQQPVFYYYSPANSIRFTITVYQRVTTCNNIGKLRGN